MGDTLLETLTDVVVVEIDQVGLIARKMLTMGRSSHKAFLEILVAI